jgi:hypothetical protein
VRRIIVLCGALAALVVALPEVAQAQDRPLTREGFFIGFGLGAGSFGCTDCGSRETGGAAFLKLGGTLSPTLLLGGESNAWARNFEGGTTLSHASVAAVLQFYPSATSGFFLKGGVGVSVLEVSGAGSGFSFSARDEGLGVTAGLGFDIRLGSNFSLSPYSNFVWGDHESGSVNNVQFGLGVIWH